MLSSHLGLLLMRIVRLLLRLHHRTRMCLLRLCMRVRVGRRLLRVVRLIGFHAGRVRSNQVELSEEATPKSVGAWKVGWQSDRCC